ncbi:MAG: hypothetical protein EB114_07495 [Betaproteobacteria bacterium]|nr:hypothetical protein [Pseudomonadota bacterium]NCV39379.1 hypothetical protein [Betaproteobacteria bacterium]NCV70320.1 hypothetical protein [Betaproteobacteria bacterium]NCX11722.1 hypothetical protein [Betaproteobacteria bacterium]NCX74066.1 hypothetical protein [Betaproteobacteria bacterium]
MLRKRYPKQGALGALGLERSKHRALSDESLHFPVLDLKSKNEKSLCFFHRHEARAAEAGHFHLFQQHRPNDVHLVAIALDWQGRPSRVFSVNRWVTGEAWMPASQTWTHFKRWRIREPRRWDHALRDALALPPEAQDLALIGLWLEALIASLENPIKDCLRARDQTLSDWIDRKPGVNVLEDQSLDVLSNIRLASGIRQLSHRQSQN